MRQAVQADRACLSVPPADGLTLVGESTHHFDADSVCAAVTGGQCCLQSLHCCAVWLAHWLPETPLLECLAAECFDPADAH